MPEKRKSLPAKEKIGVVEKEFHRGTLHSGSGAIVKNPKQAIAIGLSEARKAGAHIPKAKSKHDKKVDRKRELNRGK